MPIAAALDKLLRAYAKHYRALKRERAAMDFEDLQLLALKLLRRPEIRALYRDRFRRVMVDEAQDTNAVQFALIEAVTDGNLFMVGDAQQSIYGFRHADVELFRARGRDLQARGARLRLSMNFRSDPVILRAVNLAFERELGAVYEPLTSPESALPKSGEARSGQLSLDFDPAVELIRVSKDIDYDRETELDHWRVSEAQALAARIARLIADGEHNPGEIVILARASTGFQIYEQALGARAVPTYVVGGGGYWEQPQVAQLVAYLKALCSRADTDAWYTALLSPLCGLSLDGLVIYAANKPPAAAADSDDASADGLPAADAERLASFEAIYRRQRLQSSSLGAEQLLEDVISETGYDLSVAAMPGGRRRLANIRKLRRLARDHEAANGPDLRGFLDWIALRSEGVGARESEAPLAGEGIDAVRLMTIHAAKGLEFPVVCVADLGRERSHGARPLVLVGRDSSLAAPDARVGVLVKLPGYPNAFRALDYAAVAAAQEQREADEERRLFYVAMTRAQERLILSGASHLDGQDNSAPIGWIAPTVADQAQVRLTTFADLDGLTKFLQDAPSLGPAAEPPAAVIDTVHWDQSRPADLSPPVSTLSYSGLSTYDRCALRFKARYVLGLPETVASAARPSTVMSEFVSAEPSPERGRVGAHPGPARNRDSRTARRDRPAPSAHRSEHR